MNINYEKMIGCYNEFEKVINDIIENIKSIKNVVNSLDSSELWRGKAYNNFKTKINKLCAAASLYCEEIRTLFKKILSTIESYKQVDKMVIEKLSNAGF